MTHADLVARGARWLKNTKKCGVVLTEFHSSSPEIPDAIGFQAGGQFSILIECKTSVSDFYSDVKKPGRSGALRHHGLGRWRYYMAPPGVLTSDLVRKNRPGWGLLEVGARTVRVKLKAEQFSMSTAWRDLPVLYSYCRRIDQYGLTLDESQAAVSAAAQLKHGET